MKDNEYMQTLTEARKQIASRRLNQVYPLLANVASKLGCLHALDKIERSKETYGFLSHYFIEGVNDSGRKDMYNSLLEEAYVVCDILDSEIRKIDEYSKYYCELRHQANNRRNPDVISTELLEAIAVTELSDNVPEDYLLKAEKIEEELFMRIWVSTNFTDSEANIVEKIITEEDYPLITRLHLVSALLLGSLQYFDKMKFRILLDVLLKSNTLTLRVRSAVAIIMIMAKYPERIKLDKENMLRLDAIADNPESKSLFSDVMLNIIKARDTERINKKVRNEFIPDLQKFQSEIRRRLRQNGDEPDLLSLDVNPEWEDLLSKSGMMDKMRELQDMQSEGADVMMFAFSNLKGFPFFNSVANWFLPFSSSHSVVRSVSGGKSNMLESLMYADALICDSDRYSFVLSIGSMPASQKDMMMSQLDAQISQLKEEAGNEISGHLAQSSKNEVIRYTRDLYRFFKLYPRKREFYDPFKDDIDFLALPVIGNILDRQENLKLLAEFYFRNGYYEKSIEFFNKIIPDDAEAPLLYQKKGFAHQSIGDWSGALEEYLLAELHSPDSKWLLKKIAVCYRHLGDPDNAARYYERALELDADNIALTLGLANSTLDAGNVELALKQFYKVDFLEESSLRAWRAIAWCEFLLGNFDKSRIYYEKINFSNPGCDDYMNMGHLCMAESRFKEALYFYSEALNGWNKENGDFYKEYSRDIPILEKLGVERMSIDLILDKLPG